jgi:hypothetical protein
MPARYGQTRAGLIGIGIARVLLRHPVRDPGYWTPEQALAVIDLLDDLRERIWAHYNIRLFDLIQAEHHQRGGGDHD